MIQSLILFNLDWGGRRRACVLCARGRHRGLRGGEWGVAPPPAGNGVGYGRSVRLESLVFRAQNPFMNSNAMTYILLIILPWRSCCHKPMIDNPNQWYSSIKTIVQWAKCSKTFIVIHLHVFWIYGAAPAEARYNISGVKKAGVAVLRSVLNKTRLSTTFFDNELFFRIRKLEIMNVRT